MTASTNDMRTLQLVVRWTARLSGLVIIIVFVLMFVGEGFNPAKVKPAEWIMLLFSPLGLVLGMVLGWWREGLGGVVTLVSYLGALMVGGYSASGAAYLLICAAPGILFLLSWFLSQSIAKKRIESTEDGHPLPPSPEGQTPQ